MDVTDKWGEAVAKRGFAQIPNYLLLLNTFLEEDKRLSPVEMLVVLQLVGAWWKKDHMPFPSMVTLAARCGVSDRQIQRAINELEKRKLIERVKRRSETGIRSNNAYDLKPLIEMLNRVSKAFPNGYPRNLTKGKAKELGAQIEPSPDVILTMSGSNSGGEDNGVSSLGPMPPHIKKWVEAEKSEQRPPVSEVTFDDDP